MNSMEENVGVAIIFFNRPNAVKHVFESVAKAKPSKLFLIQDGSRGEKDDAKVAECRSIVEKIDWPCEVYKNYSEVNLGCGKRMSSGISWVFEHVEKAIILEDDCVPAESFYSFCYELLEKYKDDDRVLYISGLNHWGSIESESDYIFAYNGAIWGWATWKRAWQAFDFSASAIQNPKVQEYLLSGVQPYYAAKRDVEKWKETNKKVNNGEKLSYWAHQWRLCKYLTHSMTIVPRVNLIDNVGDADPTHPGVGDCAFHHMQTGKLQFPLRHPQYIIQDVAYDKRYYQELMPSKVDKMKSKIRLFLRISDYDTLCHT